MIEIIVTLIAQVGAIVVAAVAAYAARGAKRAAKQNRSAGAQEHSQHTDQLRSLEERLDDKLDREFATVSRDVGGIRQDLRQTREELNDIRRTGGSLAADLTVLTKQVDKLEGKL